MTNQEKMQSEGLRYMKEKYGKEEVFTIKTATIDAERYYMFLTVEGKEDWDVRLTWYEDTKSLEDNYMSWVLREEVEEIYFPLIRNVYGDCIAFNLPYGGQISDLYGMDTTVEKYLETALPSTFVVFTTSDISKKEDDMEKLYQSLDEKQLDIYVKIYYVTPEQLKAIMRENFKNTINSDDHILRGGFMKTKGDNPYFENWREGNKA